MLPFRCDVTYNTRLQLTNLLPISYWHEFLDIVFFYKAVNNLVFIDSEALPASALFCFVLFFFLINEGCIVIG